jgi:hypothetical protein
MVLGGLAIDVPFDEGHNGGDYTTRKKGAQLLFDTRPAQDYNLAISTGAMGMFTYFNIAPSLGDSPSA